MIAARPRVPVIVLALFATTLRCRSDREYRHDFTITSEVANPLFGFELDADGDTVVVGDWWDETIRMFRVSGGELVEEARFPGNEITLGYVVAIRGDRVAAAIGDSVRIYERRGKWAHVATISTNDCSAEYRPGYIALDDDAVVVLAHDQVCVYTRDGAGWHYEARVWSGEWVDGEVAIDRGVVAIPRYRTNEVALFTRADDWDRSTIVVGKPDAIAMSNGVIAVGSLGKIRVFDVASHRDIATLRPQSRRDDWPFGAEIELDGTTLAAWAADGVHVYRNWRPAGIVHSPIPSSTWFGTRLALSRRHLWVGDPDMSDDSITSGHVFGFRR